MTEISILKNRNTDDPFIAGLRDLQERLTLLSSIKFDKKKMSAVYIDRPAYPPNFPIKPNRRMIVSLATVVGLFSGIFLAFFIEFLQNQRKKHSE
jgi:chain length determinant protein (polysaccharide antigen chain regulator)